MLQIPMLRMLRIQLKFFQCIEDPANDQHQPRANYGASDAPADRWSEDSNASDAPDPSHLHSRFRGSGNLSASAQGELWGFRCSG